MAEKETAGKEKPAPAPAAPAASTGTDDSKLFGALCYIIGVIVPLFVLFTEKKSDKFLVFHAWQSLVITVIGMVVWFIVTAVVLVLAIVSSGIGSVLSCLFIPVFLAWVCVILYAAYRAYQGETYKLPMIGDFAEKQAAK